MNEEHKSLLYLVPSGFSFQQDAAHAHTAKLAQDWIAINCSKFIGEDKWPQNSWLSRPGSYAWTLQDILSQAKEHL